jgi:hypothetical protein
MHHHLVYGEKLPRALDESDWIFKTFGPVQLYMAQPQNMEAGIYNLIGRCINPARL